MLQCFNRYDTIPWEWQLWLKSTASQMFHNSLACLLNVKYLYLHFIQCLPWPAVLITSEANGRCCRGGYHNVLLPFYPFQPSSPTLTPLNPDGNPVLGHSLQASACQGSLCSPLAGTQACALKLSPPSIAASAGGYLPHRSPNWPTVAVWSLIVLNDFCFPPHWTVFELRF